MKFFNKGLKKIVKREGLLRRLKNIEDKNEEQLKIIKNKTGNIKEVTGFFEEPLSLEAQALIEEIRIMQTDVDYRKLKFRGGNNATYNFSNNKTFKQLFRELYLQKNDNR